MECGGGAGGAAAGQTGLCGGHGLSPGSSHFPPPAPGASCLQVAGLVYRVLTQPGKEGAGQGAEQGAELAATRWAEVLQPGQDPMGQPVPHNAGLACATGQVG